MNLRKDHSHSKIEEACLFCSWLFFRDEGVCVVDCKYYWVIESLPKIGLSGCQSKGNSSSHSIELLKRLLRFLGSQQIPVVYSGLLMAWRTVSEGKAFYAYAYARASSWRTGFPLFAGFRGQGQNPWIFKSWVSKKGGGSDPITKKGPQGIVESTVKKPGLWKRFSAWLLPDTKKSFLLCLLVFLLQKP